MSNNETDGSVLVTGAAGYLGSVVVGRLLAVRHRVVGLDSLRYDNARALAPYLGHSHFTFLQADIRDLPAYRQALKNASTVVHLAALVGAPICDRDPEEARQVNELATCALVKELSCHQRLVYTNSNSAYGTSTGDEELTEEAPQNPLSVYARTKCEGEKAVLNHADSVSFRLATVFGVSPRMRFDLLVNDWTMKLSALKDYLASLGGEGLPSFRIFEPGFSRNYVHVRDVAEAIAAAVWSFDDYQGVYNCGNPDANRTKWELAQTICREIGLDERVLTVDPDQRDPDQRNYRVSNEKILSRGFVFRHSLEAGIREVAQYSSLLTSDNVKEMRNV